MSSTPKKRSKGSWRVKAKQDQAKAKPKPKRGLPGLHRVRVIRDLSQDELASRVGITRQFLGQIESGRRGCSLQTLEKLMEVLQCSLADLRNA